MIRPRLSVLTRSVAVYIVSIMAVLVAITMPPLELFPFAAHSAGAALIMSASP